MAWAFKDQEEMGQSQQDEQKQDNAVLTSTAGELGAEASNAPASGASERPRDEARQPQRAASQVLARNQGKAANPFQFEQTRQALSGARQGIQTEKDQYMANAVAPYQTGQQLTGQVQQYAREGGATPEWLKKYQQGTPQALGAFSAQTNTNFAPVNAMQTNAGVRSYLRNPADPESRSGEQAIDFSLLNADPNFNLQREGVLRDYSDLLKFRQGVEAETPAAARAAQQAAFDQYKANISGTLTGEADAIQNAAKAAEAAYDAQFANLPGMRAQVAREAAAKIAGEAPEDIRGYVRGLEGQDLNAFFNPLDAASTNPEDFITEDQAGDFNRIMGILGRGGPMPTKGRLAGATGPGREALRFDEGAYRNALLNRARTEYDRAKASPFANTGAYDAGGATFPTTAPATPSAPTAGGGGVGYSPEDRLGQSWQQVGDFFSNMGTFNPDVRLPSWGGPGGGLRFSDGGRVPGEPMVPGDSEMNDVVDIKASPGEIVIPRSAAQDKESAKEFIDNMPFGKTRDLLKNKYMCGGKVGDYACGGMVKGYAEGGPVEQQIEADYDKAYNSPLPGVKQAKQQFDDYLTENVVEPMAQRGYPDLGAALATVPSTVVDAFVPSTTGDVLMGAAPFPKTLRNLKRFDEKGKPFENVGMSEFTAREAPKVPNEFMSKVSGKSYDEASLDPVNKVFSNLMQEMQKQDVRFSPEEAEALREYIKKRLDMNKEMAMKAFYKQDVAGLPKNSVVPARGSDNRQNIDDYYNIIDHSAHNFRKYDIFKKLNKLFLREGQILSKDPWTYDLDPRFVKADEYLKEVVPFERDQLASDEAFDEARKMYLRPSSIFTKSEEVSAMEKNYRKK